MAETLVCDIKITHSKMVGIPEISGKSGYGSSGMFLPGAIPTKGY